MSSNHTFTIPTNFTLEFEDNFDEIGGSLTPTTGTTRLVVGPTAGATGSCRHTRTRPKTHRS